MDSLLTDGFGSGLIHIEKKMILNTDFIPLQKLIQN